MDHGSSITPWDLERMLCDETAEPKALPLSLLEGITNGFSDEQRIGSGGFAVVYKGNLENRSVAVKRMFNTYMYEKEFQREVECLMMVKHKNVVRFLGYCADTQGNMARHKGKFIMADIQQRLLCFEYLPKGSLLEYITEDKASGLHWGHRYQIINGICHGLHYLHQNNIVHLDLKPGNILLDANLVAKIADFGLSRCFDMQSRVITVKIRGTLGYLAPEFCNGEITYLFDIYSLGVIIMEILTGKKGYQDVDKVVQSWSNTLEKSHSDVQLKQVRVCAEIGIECINSNPAKRPDAQHIVDILDATESMEENIETGMIPSQQVTDSPSEQAKKYASPVFNNGARRTTIKPGSVQLVTKNNMLAPLLAYRKKVMLELTGGDYTSDRPGLDLVAVVDVSYSTQGGKMGQLKTALRFLVLKLGPMDRLCIMTNNGQLWPLSPITEGTQQSLKGIIYMLESLGGTGTRMENGLQDGLNVLANREVRVGRVAAIMLVPGYQRIGRPSTSVDAGDVPVYTFCLGGRYSDPTVLSELAAKSIGGTFFHVVEEDSRGLTMAFSQCLAGLLSVAVQNLELRVAAVRGESKILKVTAGSYPQEQHKDDSVTVRFGNLYSTEVRKVFVELLLPTVYSERSAEILDVTYSHDRSAGRMKLVAPPETLTVWRSGGLDFPEEDRPAGLLTEEARLQITEMIKEARTMADSKRLYDAQVKIMEAQNMAEEGSNSYLRTQLRELLELFKTQKTYETQGLPYALSSESCHNLQRLAGRGGDIEVMRLFATPRMDKYLEQAKKFLNEPTMPLPSEDDDGMEEVGTVAHNVASKKEEMQRLAVDVVVPGNFLPHQPKNSSPWDKRFGGLFGLFRKKRSGEH